MEFKKITYELKDKIIHIGFGKFEKKSMTVLDEETLKELELAFDKAKEESEAKGLVLFSHKKNCFLAGMDVSVIEALDSEARAQEGCENVHQIFNKLEDLKIPTMALVHGVCLGGGLELSLCCDKIMVSDSKSTALGLPEVMLGILPGFGGTYRLPRKVGLTSALDMILTGKQLRAKKARKVGLADFIVPFEKMLELAPEYLNKESKNKKTLVEELTDKASENFLARKVIFQKAREKVLDNTKGLYPAPLKILTHLEENYGKKRSSFLSAEAKNFAELSQTFQAKNLQHIFFMQDNAKKMKNKEEIPSVKKGAVLGAGVMGGGIAWLFAKNKQRPLMKDISTEGLELGLKQSSSVFRKQLKRKRLSAEDFQRLQRSITPTLTYSGFKNVDLVVEAVVENMNVKKNVLKELEENVSPDALITTNTSSLSIEEMASALDRPENFAGLHFFNPVNKMPLVEIVKHSKVSNETLDRLYKWCLEVKKTPVIVNDCPGFLVNRILAPFLNEAAYLLEEGVSVEDIDKATLSFGMPMGACRLMDEVGLDVGAHVGEIMEEGIGARMKACSLSKKLIDAGLLGKKNKRGLYLYDEKDKVKEVNSDALKLLPKNNIKMNTQEIQRRMILPMINEAAYILSEKIVDKAQTVDLALIFGIGFPPFRGGLLKYADAYGLDKAINEIKSFAESVDSERYSLSKFLEKMSKDKTKFYDL